MALLPDSLLSLIFVGLLNVGTSIIKTGVFFLLLIFVLEVGVSQSTT